VSRAQKQSGVLALKVGFVVAYVSARCREIKFTPVVEHPFQGWLPYLKLVWQPSVQLLEVFSSAASFAITESFAGAGF
jgi:hypothetical protein